MIVESIDSDLTESSAESCYTAHKFMITTGEIPDLDGTGKFQLQLVNPTEIMTAPAAVIQFAIYIYP